MKRSYITGTDLGIAVINTYIGIYYHREVAALITITVVMTFIYLFPMLVRLLTSSNLHFSRWQTAVLQYGISLAAFLCGMLIWKFF